MIKFLLLPTKLNNFTKRVISPVQMKLWKIIILSIFKKSVKTYQAQNLIKLKQIPSKIIQRRDRRELKARTKII